MRCVVMIAAASARPAANIYELIDLELLGTVDYFTSIPIGDALSVGWLGGWLVGV